MIETPNNSEQSPVDQQIEQWKKGPTILASSSVFRRDQLENIGFEDVSFSEYIPESVETDLAAKMEQTDGAPRTHWDSDGRLFSEHIAAAKVQHTIDHTDVDPEALVVSFDTTAVVYEDPTDEQIMGGVPRSAEKYETIAAAKADMLHRFQKLSEGMAERALKLTEFKRVQKMIGSTEEEIEMVPEGHMVGIRQGAIYVTTGAAVAFPTAHDSVYRFSEEARLNALAVEATEGDEQALEKLVDLIVETQGEEKTLSISGGIDYADSYVRDILQIEEIQPFGKEIEDEALYKGFAAKALDVLLHMRAEELERNRAA